MEQRQTEHQGWAVIGFGLGVGGRDSRKNQLRTPAKPLEKKSKKRQGAGGGGSDFLTVKLYHDI